MWWGKICREGWWKSEAPKHDPLRLGNMILIVVGDDFRSRWWKSIGYVPSDPSGRCQILTSKAFNLTRGQHRDSHLLRFSPFNKPFKEEIDEWNDKLMYVSECQGARRNPGETQEGLDFLDSHGQNVKPRVPAGLAGYHNSDKSPVKLSPE